MIAALKNAIQDTETSIKECTVHEFVEQYKLDLKGLHEAIRFIEQVQLEQTLERLSGTKHYESIVGVLGNEKVREEVQEAFLLSSCQSQEDLIKELESFTYQLKALHEEWS